ncbi:MAG: glycosyltransferase family 2 protein [Oscillospiraceae bacterium]|nr:glycosyltransferase family 2 protein [Oscillospiraceae bacterium]
MLPLSAPILRDKWLTLMDRGAISRDSRITLVDDGSADGTWQIIRELCDAPDSLFSAVKLSHNRGHQNALLAGLESVMDRCDAAVSLDADLQDDIDVIDRFIEEYENGCDIVYGVRDDRSSDSFAKRVTAQGYYKFLKLLGVDIIYNHADYRLMSRRALHALSGYRETNLFLRGIIPELGFPSAIVTYARREREAGESKYTLPKMLKLAFDGITSFSVRPIRILALVGVLTLLVAVVMAVYTLVRHFTGNTVSGWSSLMISIWFLGGLNLLALGVVGEYIGKIYSEVKQRPRYIVEETVGLDQ